MCGRYTLFSSIKKLKELFGLVNEINMPQTYNAAPSQHLPIIIKNRIGLASWGFVPSWGEPDKAGVTPINARSETAAGNRMFGESYARRRCLVPVNGFYEWEKTENGKRPWYMHADAQEVLALAGLWSVHEKGGEKHVSFCILTRPASGAITKIHHRMPVIIKPEEYPRWIEKGMMPAQPYDLLSAYPVSPQVNDPRRNMPDLIAKTA